MSNEVAIVEAEELTREEIEKQAVEEAAALARELLDYAAEAGMDEEGVCELLASNGFEGAPSIDDLGEAGFKARVFGPFNNIISV
ncbi:MAG TPA: hypothetical protein VN086_01425 [Candidatus Paceibacterota bacterium]|nr:hypothetical protein [Candidatus Paceibacterota bacterium]